MTVEIPAQSEWLRAGVASRPTGVDREQKAIFGMVLAQEGPFQEDPPRGEFDVKSLRQIVKLGNASRGGLKSNFTHGTLSGDGLGNHLGRVRNLRMDSVTVDRPEGIVSLEAVRGDIFFADAAFDSPNGNLAGYVMQLAEDDPDALSSSLVVKPKEEVRLESGSGRPRLDDEGNQLPPLWRPLEVRGSDIVASGAAVDGLLSAEIDADGLNDALVRKGFELLSGFLPGQSREVVEARLSVWMQRALSLRFGDDASERECGHIPESVPLDRLGRALKNGRRHRDAVRRLEEIEHGGSGEEAA